MLPIDGYPLESLKVPLRKAKGLVPLVLEVRQAAADR